MDGVDKRKSRARVGVREREKPQLHKKSNGLQIPYKEPNNWHLGFEPLGFGQRFEVPGYRPLAHHFFCGRVVEHHERQL